MSVCGHCNDTGARARIVDKCAPHPGRSTENERAYLIRPSKGRHRISLESLRLAAVLVFKSRSDTRRSTLPGGLDTPAQAIPGSHATDAAAPSA